MPAPLFSPSFSGKPGKDVREAIPHRLVQKRMGLRSKVRTAEVRSSAAFFAEIYLLFEVICYDIVERKQEVLP